MTSVEAGAPRRRRFPRLRLSVRMLMLLVLVAGALLGRVAYRASVQRKLVAAIDPGNGISYDWQYDYDRYSDNPHLSNRCPSPRWLVNAVGLDLLHEPAYVSLGANCGDTRAATASPEQLVELTSRLSSLQGLGVELPGLTDAGLAPIARLTRLRELLLIFPDSEANIPVKATGAGMAYLEGLSSLERLTLGYMDLRNDDLAHLSKLTRLKHLDISLPTGSSVGDGGLAHLATLCNLEELVFSGSQATGNGLEALRGMTRLRSLTIDGDQLATLEPLRGHLGLEELSIESSQVDAAEFAAAGSLPNLKTLHVNASPMLDDAAIAHLRGKAGLEEVWLTGTPQIGDEGFIALATCPDLRVVVASDTNLGGAGLTILSRAPSLKYIRVGDRVSAQAIVDARAAHPALRIDR